MSTRAGPTITADRPIGSKPYFSGSCGVEEGQGYLVAAPLPFAKFIELVTARGAAIAAEPPLDDAALVA